MEEQKKISLPEGIIMVLIVLCADIVEILVDLTGFGIIIGEVINFAVGAMIEFWLFIKGIKGFWKLTSWGIGTLLDGALASFLPIKTITLIITIWLVNHPKAAQVAEVATGKIASAVKTEAL